MHAGETGMANDQLCSFSLVANCLPSVWKGTRACQSAPVEQNLLTFDTNAMTTYLFRSTKMHYVHNVSTS